MIWRITLAISVLTGICFGESTGLRNPDRTVRVAVVQAGEDHYEKHNPGPEANFKALAQQAREAAASVPKPDIISFPEYSLSGWPYPEEKEINKLAEKIPGDGPWYQRYRDLARDTGTALLCSMVELDGDKRYNTGCIIDGKGEFRGKYRKVHATLGEQGWWGWSKGQGFKPIELDGVRYGVSICADMWFPETVRCYELLGADVILHQSIGDDMERVVPTRAFDSARPIAMAIFQGGSYAVDREGKVLGKLSSKKPGWKVFDLQPFKKHIGHKFEGLYELRKAIYNMRSPSAYDVLTNPSLRPPWTEVFLDNKEQPQSRADVLKRFKGHYDADDPGPTTAPNSEK